MWNWDGIGWTSECSSAVLIIQQHFCWKPSLKILYWLSKDTVKRCEYASQPLEGQMCPLYDRDCVALAWLQNHAPLSSSMASLRFFPSRFLWKELKRTEMAWMLDILDYFVCGFFLVRKRVKSWSWYLVIEYIDSSANLTFLSRRNF